MRLLRACTIAIGFPLVVAGPALAQSDSARNAVYYARAAERALRAGDTAAYLRDSRQTYALAPAHPSAVYALARALAMNGRANEAVAMLARGAGMGDVRPMENDSALVSLRGRADFARVVARLIENRRPVITGDTALVIPDPDFLPEGFARDPATGATYVGSLSKAKVIRVETGGAVADVLGPEAGLLRVVGIKIDSARRTLWFATYAPGDSTAASPALRVSRSRVFRYDLAEGRLAGQYAPADSLRGHLLNDLVITRAGDVYITDTDGGGLYRIRAGSDSMESFLRPDSTRFSYPNGITLSANESRLYVAFLEGIASVDLRTRRVVPLSMPADVSTSSIDGLYSYRSSLIGVQTGPSFERVIRFDLDPSGLRIRRARVLARGHPALQGPTTGGVVGDEFWYIANSQYFRQADDGTLRPVTDDRKSVILRVPLAR